MNCKTAIVSVIYEEPEWQKTRDAIKQCKVPTVYVDRNGVGSLARAYNAGFKTAIEKYKPQFVWFVSNPIFNPDVLLVLEDSLESNPIYAAVHPAFESDHLHLRPDGQNKLKEVPYIEFTAPFVRASVFHNFPLDELMPYWGHDLDWSYKVKRAGFKVAVHTGAELKHEYIRFKSQVHPATRERHALRKATNASTIRRLIGTYGTNWRKVLNYA